MGVNLYFVCIECSLKVTNVELDSGREIFKPLQKLVFEHLKYGLFPLFLQSGHFQRCILCLPPPVEFTDASEWVKPSTYVVPELVTPFHFPKSLAEMAIEMYGSSEKSKASSFSLSDAADFEGAIFSQERKPREVHALSLASIPEESAFPFDSFKDFKATPRSRLSSKRPPLYHTPIALNGATVIDATETDDLADFTQSVRNRSSWKYGLIPKTSLFTGNDEIYGDDVAAPHLSPIALPNQSNDLQDDDSELFRSPFVYKT